ncbi:MAG: hypothetical protein WD749_03315 [Phycisphaerales bacterium]
MRRWLLCATAVIGVLGVSGCGSQPTVSDAGEPAPRQRLGAGDSVGWSVHSSHHAMSETIRRANVDVDGH